MTVLHSGSNNQYSTNFSRAFAKGKPIATAKPTRKAAKKTSKSKK